MAEASSLLPFATCKSPWQRYRCSGPSSLTTCSCTGRLGQAAVTGYGTNISGRAMLCTYCAVNCIIMSHITRLDEEKDIRNVKYFDRPPLGLGRWEEVFT